MNTQVTINTLQAMKARGEKIACLTAYDASFAARVDAAGVDVVLVGDSLGMVVQGEATTLPVQMEDVIYHTCAVARGLKRALLIADMPFMSYATLDRALTNAARLVQEGGAQMVKLEGGADQVETVRALTRNTMLRNNCWQMPRLCKMQVRVFWWWNAFRPRWQPSFQRH
jgi:3-methyl-2-oxobutanoate hydroxymethyltransferase